MIARLTILLPFDLLIREGDALPALDVQQPERRIRFHPPVLYATRPDMGSSLMAPSLALGQARAPVFSDSQVVDGKKTGLVNVLQLDIIKPEFDRRPESIALPNPDIQAAFEVANSVLARIRVYDRASQIKPLQTRHDPWQLAYVSDDGRQLEPEEGKIRYVTGTSSIIGYPAITPESIQMVAERQNSEEPYAWDNLLLDAYSLLPDIGGSIVMANAALEVFISWALDALNSENPLPGNIWDWINKRDHWTKNPSVTEEFDALLQVFGGHSLKNEARLWQQLTELRKARNSLVHEGMAKIGSAPVTPGKAKELVDSAKEIIGWVEVLLPTARRRARPEAQGPFGRKMVTAEEATSMGIDVANENPTTPKVSDETRST